MVEKLLVTVAVAADMASVGRSTGYALVASGEWPSIAIGRSRRIPLADLRSWIQKRVGDGGAPTEVQDRQPTDEVPPAA